MIPELQKFREKYPDYNDVSDTQLAQKLAEKYPDSYGDLPSKLNLQISAGDAAKMPVVDGEPLNTQLTVPTGYDEQGAIRENVPIRAKEGAAVSLLSDPVQYAKDTWCS
jgi:hypothetical protein